MIRLMVAAIVLLGMASPALAGHCPKDIKKINAALANQTDAKAANLLNKGKKLHKAGKHDESLEALHQAMKMLGIKH